MHSKWKIKYYHAPSQIHYCPDIITAALYVFLKIIIIASPNYRHHRGLKTRGKRFVRASLVCRQPTQSVSRYGTKHAHSRYLVCSTSTRHYSFSRVVRCSRDALSILLCYYHMLSPEQLFTISLGGTWEVRNIFNYKYILDNNMRAKRRTLLSYEIPGMILEFLRVSFSLLNYKYVHQPRRFQTGLLFF